MTAIHETAYQGSGHFCRHVMLGMSTKMPATLIIPSLFYRPAVPQARTKEHGHVRGGEEGQRRRDALLFPRSRAPRAFMPITRYERLSEYTSL